MEFINVDGYVAQEQMAIAQVTSILSIAGAIRGYYVSVLQKLTGYRRIPCQELVSPRGVSRVVKRTFLTGFPDTLSVFVKH